jgi:glycosyltransferase involved in cell wall biosynthesis
MVNIKVSVVVPVYNAETHLEQCIFSLLNQTLADIEIIIVNDGSSDGSKVIIDQLAAQHPCIEVLHRPNEGVSSARNNGIKVAKGEFIGFVDADDYAEPQLFETLYNNAINTQADIAICNSNVIYENHSIPMRLQLENKTIDIRDMRQNELISWMRFKYDNANWNKIYSSAVIKNNGLLFSEAISVWEDLLFNLCYLQYATKAVVVDTCLYNYRVHPQSVMVKKGFDMITQYNLLFEGFSAFCITHGFQDSFETFRNQMGRNLYYGMIPQLKEQIADSGLTFSKRAKSLATLLSRVHPGILNYNSDELTGLQGFKKRLLMSRSNYLFSIIVTLRKPKN